MSKAKKCLEIGDVSPTFEGVTEDE